MRKLKFRAWNSYTKKWLSLFPMQDIRDPFPKDKDIIIQQYTGLKDKNGKDIYEGDVLDCHIFGFNGNETEHEFRAIIEWCVDSSGFGLKVIENTSTSLYPGLLYPIPSIYGLHEESFEIIGNIHENPELLEVKTEV